MPRKRPLSPSTLETYRARLQRAYGRSGPPFGEPIEDLRAWTGPMRAQLHAALKKFDPDRLVDLPDETYEVKRAIRPPTETELATFEKGADAHTPAVRAMLLLPLALGLRASELLKLKRRDVERAVSGENLLVFRKGGKERLLPCDTARPLLSDLLKAGPWSEAWQILSSAGDSAAYQILRRRIRMLGGDEAKLRPHKLRHGFATRLLSDGAELPHIQNLMDHKDPATTMRYVHPEERELVKFMRPMKGKK